MLRLSVLAVWFAAHPLAVGAAAKRELPSPPTVWEQLMARQSRVKMREGFELMQRGFYERAIKVYAKAVLSEPKNPYARMLLGSAYYWAGAVDRAISEYRESIRLKGDEPQSHQLLAIALVWKGDPAKALEEFELAEKYGPDHADVQMNLGSVNMSLGRVSKAMEHFRKAVRLEPENPLYHHQLGLLYSRVRRDEDALDRFDKAIELFPRFEEALLESGAVLERLERRKEGGRRFKRAVRLKPRDNVARFRWALNRWEAGEWKEVDSILKDAFWVSPDRKGRGLALSVAFSGGGASAPGADAGDAPRPKQEDSSPVGMIRRNLERVPLEEEARVEVQVVYLPKPKLELEKASEGDAMEEALKQSVAASEATTMGSRREFRLPPASKAKRRRQLEAISRELEGLVRDAPPDSEMRLGFNLRTRKPDAVRPEEDLDDPTRPKSKVSYKPREVGNDLGLWVKGSGWIALFKEVVPGLQEVLVSEELEKGRLARGWLLLGLAHSSLGEGGKALLAFAEAARLMPEEPEPFLGIAVASVIQGDETGAIDAYKKALEVDPGNKVAKRSLRWLERPRL